MNTNKFQYKSRESHFQIGTRVPPYANEEALLSESPIEVQKLIVDVYNLSQKYSTNKPINESESFEESLISLDSSLNNMFSSNLIHLTREIDFIQADIDKFRSTLVKSQSVLHDTSSSYPMSKTNSFFEDYCKSLFQKKKMINESIYNLGQNEREYLTSINVKEAFNLLHSMLNEQHDSIVRCSSRIYNLNEKTELIKNKIQSYYSTGAITRSSLDKQNSIPRSSNQQTIMSSTEKLIARYHEHVEERKRNLEKHITDRSLFTKDSGKKSYAFGTGNRYGAPKQNYGLNNATSKSFAGNTNKNISNQGLSTPSMSFKQNSNSDLTPILNAKLGGGQTGIVQDQVTPRAPKKGLVRSSPY